MRIGRVLKSATGQQTTILEAARTNLSRFCDARSTSRLGPKAAAAVPFFDVRFSNRPFGVKRFQTIRRCSVDVTHGLVLLFGIGTKALPSWDSKTRWNNLSGGLAARVTVGPSGSANSPHPSSREGHHSTAGWSSSFLLLDLILHSFHAATGACSGSSGTRCRQPRCGAGSRPTGVPAPRSPFLSHAVWRSASPGP
jgi:hypothetical protein